MSGNELNLSMSAAVSAGMREAPAVERNVLPASAEAPAPSSSRAPLRVTRISTVRDFAGLRLEWTELAESSGAGLFSSWEWLFAWYERMGSARELWILTARTEDGALVGVLPASLEQRKLWGRTIRRLAFLGDSHVGSDYLDVISEPGCRDAVVRAFAEVLVRRRGEWDVCDLLDLDEDSPTLGTLRQHLQEATLVERTTERYLCPFERLEPGLSFDGFLRRTGRRDNYLRRRKWLEKQPGFVIEKHEKPGELPQPLAEFFRLHSLRWAEDGGSQGIRGPSVEAFHRDATQLLAERGKVRLYTMRLDGKAVASVYGLLHQGQFLYYQSGYDPRWRSKSVGLVLVGETFRDAIEQGCHEYDFLRGTESYKSDWVTQKRRTVALRFHAREARGAWLTWNEELGRQMRNGVKSLLPARWTEQVRRWRRAASRV